MPRTGRRPGRTIRNHVIMVQDDKLVVKVEQNLYVHQKTESWVEKRDLGAIRSDAKELTRPYFHPRYFTQTQRNRAVSRAVDRGRWGV